ncbi:MAG TPA: hypothetical protein VHF92_10490 [Geodermatophilus sp.]|nr:hypothetical protein [Geodermatophilus sp.]
MNPRLRATVLAPVAAFLLVGCGGPAGDTGPRSEPAPAQAEQSAAAAADPAAAGTPAEAALAVALRAADLPPGWSVQANPVPDGDLSDDPSLAGICGAAFPSEARRTAKFPVVGLDPAGNAAVVSEAISYDSAQAAAAALAELRAAFASCPPGERTIVEAPPVDGLAADNVVAAYRLPDGATQEVIAQARGAVLSVLIGEDAEAAAGAARAVAARLAALPPAAIGL